MIKSETCSKPLCVDYKMAAVYRGNNANIRDCWAGVSSDGGAGFSDGTITNGWECLPSGTEAAKLGVVR